MSNNLLIVESLNDKFFIERLKLELTTVNFDVDTPICNIAEYECLDGLSQNSLEAKFQEIVSDIEKKGLDKIGILLDADNMGILARVGLINNAVKSIDSSLDISTVNTWYESTSLQVQISCHILNINGSGELETMLKTIKSKPSLYADCLNSWKNCLISQKISISDKDFDKFWVSIYQRYDCCSSQEQKQAGRKCNSEASLQKDIWDFSHKALDDLKLYLMMFN